MEIEWERGEGGWRRAEMGGVHSGFWLEYRVFRFGRVKVSIPSLGESSYNILYVCTPHSLSTYYCSFTLGAVREKRLDGIRYISAGYYYGTEEYGTIVEDSRRNSTLCIKPTLLTSEKEGEREKKNY